MKKIRNFILFSLILFILIEFTFITVPESLEFKSFDKALLYIFLKSVAAIVIWVCAFIHFREELK